MKKDHGNTNKIKARMAILIKTDFRTYNYIK